MFRVNMPTAILAGEVVRDDGEQLNQAIELSAYGQATQSLRLLGGLTYLDTEYRRTEFGRNEGNTVIGVPEIQANLGLESDVLQGLSVDGRVVYTSSQQANLAKLNVRRGRRVRRRPLLCWRKRAHNTAWNDR